MIAVPVNPNSVYVSMVQTGCLKAEFDSTYSVHLNGIISQDEFQQSISNINRTITSNKTSIIIFTISFTMTMIIGTICFMIAGITAANSLTYIFYVLMVVGIVVTTIGSLLFSIGLCIIHSRRTARMRQVIAEESMKYSSRSPTPCSWRLDIIRGWNRGFEYQRNGQATYNLVIDIGRSVGSGGGIHYSNKDTPAPGSSFAQDNYPPPSYSGQSNVGFCSQCGVLRQDLMAEFCSSCGQAFNL